jgi:hypothetical protein
MPRIVAEGWRACPPGEFDRLEAYLRRTRVWKMVLTTAVVVAATVAVAAASWIVVEALRPPVAFEGSGGGCSPMVAPIVVPCHPANQ